MNLILVLETKLERNWTAGTAKNVFLNVLVSEALYRPLRLCIGLYRPSEPAGGLKMVVRAVHKFNFCSGDKIQSKSALWCKIWSCFGLCGTLEAAICYWRPPTASQ